MTNREKIMNVLRRGRVDAAPVSVRMDLWHNHAKLHNRLPGEIAGLSCEEVEDYLGFCRTARFRNYYSVTSSACMKSTLSEGDDTVTRYAFKKKTLVSVKRQSPEMREQGIQPILIEHPIKEMEDYSLMENFYQSANLTYMENEFVEFERKTADKGLPILILYSCPTHELILNFTGYEQFYTDYFDCPDSVRSLIRTMETFYKTKLWPTAANSSAQVILHGNHFSSKMTPLPIFKEYFVPYFSEFCDFMHSHGKYVAFHSDADLGELKPLISEIGFDIADCLATAPLVEEQIEDYFNAWNGKVVCWGGLPSTIFSPEYPVDEYEKYVDELISKVKGRNDFIFGASDNVMPFSQWEKIKYLAEKTVTQ